jgi:hypothetical protein
MVPDMLRVGSRRDRACGVLAAAVTLVASTRARGAGGASLRACAGGAAGRWTAQGRGFAVDHATALPWVATTAGLDLRVPIREGILLSSRLEGYLPVLRPVLQERDTRGAATSASEPPPAGMGASLGVTVVFP